MLLDLIKPILRPNVGHLAVLAAVGLVCIGIAAIDTTPVSDAASYEIKQAAFAAVGLAAMALVALPQHRLIAPLAFPMALGALGLLVFILIPGVPQWLVPVRFGARRWIDFGPVSLQPSELAKIAFILALAKYLRFRENYRTLAGLIPPALITLAPMGIILVEPDLGTSLVFVPVLASMLIAAGARMKHLAIIALLLIVAMPAMYPLLKPYQKERITAIVAQWKGDARHRDKEGFQGFKAMTLTGSGRVAGYGQDRARTILQFNALPEAQNDMVFAVVCTRWGLLGGLTVLGLHALIAFSGLAAAASNKDPFARMICVGAVAAIFTQVVINIGMVIGLMPITGISLPLVSYGGSSLLTTFLMIGLILSAGARRPIIMARRSFEF